MRRPAFVSSSYFGVLGLLGLLGVLVLLPLEPIPLELGDVVLLLPLLPMPLELGEVLLEPLLLAPPLAPLLEELDLKCASHSEREICPSLFVSTCEKVGVELLDAPPLLDIPLELPPLAELSPLDMPDEPDELPDGVALCEDLSELLPEAPVDDEEPELCAMDTPAIAKSAAAVAVPTSFNIWTSSFTRIKG